MAKLSELMKNAQDITGQKAAQPVSHVQMADLLAQLKEPKVHHEPTPFGTVTRDVNDAHNRDIVKRVEAMQEKLAERRGEAKEAFKLPSKQGEAVEAFKRARGRSV